MKVHGRFHRCCGPFLVLLLGLSCSAERLGENEIAVRVGRLERALERIHSENYRQQWQRFTGGIAEEQDLPGSGLPWYEHPAVAGWRGTIEDPLLARLPAGVADSPCRRPVRTRRTVPGLLGG